MRSLIVTPPTKEGGPAPMTLNIFRNGTSFQATTFTDPVIDDLSGEHVGGELRDPPSGVYEFDWLAQGEAGDPATHHVTFTLEALPDEPAEPDTPEPAPVVANATPLYATQGTTSSRDLAEYVSGGVTPYSYALAAPVDGVILVGSLLTFTDQALVGSGTIEVQVTGANSVSSITPIQVPWLVQAAPAAEEVVVYLNDGTFEIVTNPAETATFTLDPPHIHAGTYTLTPTQQSSLANGPICIAVPTIGLSQDSELFQVTRIGLWAYDKNLGEMATSRLWHKNGTPIAGETGQTLPVSGNRGASIQHVERAVQPGLQRLGPSETINLPQLGGPDFFDSLPNGTLLRGLVLGSGYEWSNPDNSNNIAVVQNGGLRASTANGSRFMRRSDPDVSDDHAAIATMIVPPEEVSGDARMGLGLRIQTWNTGYAISFSGVAWWIRRTVEGATKNMGSSVPATYAGPIVAEAQAINLQDGTVWIGLYVNDVLIAERIDNDPARLLTGRPGVNANGNDMASQNRAAITSYDQRNL